VVSAARTTSSAVSASAMAADNRLSRPMPVSALSVKLPLTIEG
jgi:hypothetical protein